MDNFAAIYEREFAMVWHICLAYMKNTHDAEDALSETFLRLMKYCEKKPGAFDDISLEAKEKKIRSWLAVTAGNVCKDQLKGWWRKREQLSENEDNKYIHDKRIEDDVLRAVMELPDKYKLAVYMHYYMGYTSGEIAKLIHKPASTVRNYLSRARDMLKLELTDGSLS